MSIGNKIKDAMSRKFKEFGDAVAEKYRERIGEELTQKKAQLEQLEAQLKQRKLEITEREASLAKYYLVPRRYIDVPLGLGLLVGIYFGWQFIASNLESNEPARGSAAPTVLRSSPGSTTAPSSSSCIAKGIAYYKEIGSYPKLSTGEDARRKVEGMCRRSNGMAFGK